MVQVLRADAGSLGLVTANGGTLDKHAFGVLSSEPPANGFRYEHPQDEIDRLPGRAVDGDHQGPATLETWTVIHERDGSMARAIAACLTPRGERTWASSHDAEVMARFEREDVTGLGVTIDADHVLQIA
jgi:acetyl-CoA C-acetyltransferase